VELRSTKYSISLKKEAQYFVPLYNTTIHSGKKEKNKRNTIFGIFHKIKPFPYPEILADIFLTQAPFS